MKVYSYPPWRDGVYVRLCLGLLVVSRSSERRLDSEYFAIARPRFEQSNNRSTVSQERAEQRGGESFTSNRCSFEPMLFLCTFSRVVLAPVHHLVET